MSTVGRLQDMDAASRAQEIVRRLQPQYGGLSTGLAFSSPLELLVATILSAQCTDERVNQVTPALFARYTRPEDYANAPAEEIEGMIHSCGFFRSKTKNLQSMARCLVERHSGQVPDRMEDLIRLPGVARKTANVVLSHAFIRNEGIAVDTHVQRLSRRLQLSRENGPEKIERDLMALLPSSEWGHMSDLLIWHGRRICGARAPRCSDCMLADICPSAGTG